MVCLVLGILVGQSTAQGTTILCYAACFIPCMADPSTTTFYCTTKCLKGLYPSEFYRGWYQRHP
ncbi:hypothetical protein POUND7_003534 [Theobroma cacao]